MDQNLTDLNSINDFFPIDVNEWKYIGTEYRDRKNTQIKSWTNESGDMLRLKLDLSSAVVLCIVYFNGDAVASWTEK
ncbi:hypothetical protein [Lactobacillus jensenii]|uniref:Uncharacterized protein n=2 Tax=Lactobacillus TaxID=1578 RepID=A0ABU9FJW1_LACJE|nr:hypothetical protein [Lactobacillus jensenii]DAR66716.1 MAG TPA: hypothetical protein [Caudoviricetes sp.]MCW8072178.1 hypothetical protein [Lactobacillus jensenii]MCW8089594.1 hypothetical protein [Lactobacillus jensenii]MDK8236076.1 hypothetical protein [Lactobacillus jensenii]MDT9544364.1 hypothetical protein [Lactobacillus jensenii]